MDCARTRMHDAGNDIGERAGRAYGRAAARTHDGTSDSARVTLLSEDCEDSCEIPLRHGSNDLCRGRPIVPHAHVERPVVTEGKSAGSLVELHRGDAEVEYHAIDLLMSGALRDSFQVRESASG